MTDREQKLCWFKKNNIIVMSVSVLENEIVCYNGNNAIANAKARMQKRRGRGQTPFEKK